MTVLQPGDNVSHAGRAVRVITVNTELGEVLAHVRFGARRGERYFAPIAELEGLEELARIRAIEARLPGDFYRMHPGAQQHAWRVAAAELGLSPTPSSFEVTS
jgi:hypothetical protein